MRLVFFGTPDFASRSLEKILSSRHQVVAVVTAPDKPRGRGRKMEPTAVKILAQGKNLEILQPGNLKNSHFIEKLRTYNADLFCVVAFRILPEEIFTIPGSGCINLHGSLLPRLRGAAPINWAIIRGETETGLTTFFIRRQVDTGAILMQRKIAIGPDETFGELYNKMAECGAELLVKTIDLIEAGNYRTAAQDDSLATTAPKLTPGLGNIDWTTGSIEVHNLIRGLSPKPGAYSFRDGRKVLILRSRRSETISDDSPGRVIFADPQQGFTIACGNGAIDVVQIRPESGKTISGAEFVRGYRLQVGEIFERKIG